MSVTKESSKTSVLPPWTLTHSPASRGTPVNADTHWERLKKESSCLTLTSYLNISDMNWYELIWHIRGLQSHKNAPFPRFWATRRAASRSSHYRCVQFSKYCLWGQTQKIRLHPIKIGSLCYSENKESSCAWPLWAFVPNAVSTTKQGHRGHWVTTYVGISTWRHGLLGRALEHSATSSEAKLCSTAAKTESSTEKHRRWISIRAYHVWKIKAYYEIQNGRTLRVNAADKSNRANCIELPPLSCLTRELEKNVWNFENWEGR